MMKIYLCILLSLFLLASHDKANAESKILADCGSMSGYAYYIETDPAMKGMGGWKSDKISSGSVRLIAKDNQSIDLVFGDSRDKEISTKQSGGEVLPLRLNKDELLLIIIYEGATTEVYHFYKEGSSYKYSSYQNKSFNLPISKDSLMIGTCTNIDFEKVIELAKYLQNKNNTP